MLPRSTGGLHPHPADAGTGKALGQAGTCRGGRSDSGPGHLEPLKPT